MTRCFVCHYHEIGLKKNNRGFFEKRLAENIKTALAGLPYRSVQRIQGRVLVLLREEIEPAQIGEIGRRLQNVFGLVSASPAWIVQQNLETMQATAWQLMAARPFETFCVRARRSDKRFPLNSQQINEQVGAFLVQRSGRHVRLEDSDLVCHIELVADLAILYFEKLPAVGGLPVGSSGKAVALISGGIDSPVAAYKIMKRGCRVLFVHFHGFPHTTLDAQEKVRRLVRILAHYQGGADLYLVPFAEAQRQIVAFTPPETRVILYRRLMLRLAERIARKRDALALVTGDSIGQVASQTLENLGAIGAVAGLPLLRPLVGEDKEEIIAYAKRIGTFDVSIIGEVDCCSLFVPRHPETRCSPEAAAENEARLELDAIMRQALEATAVERIDQRGATPA
jgi:thiamine biosynthesis protein ThiI